MIIKFFISNYNGATSNSACIQYEDKQLILYLTKSNNGITLTENSGQLKAEVNLLDKEEVVAKLPQMVEGTSIIFNKKTMEDHSQYFKDDDQGNKEILLEILPTEVTKFTKSLIADIVIQFILILVLLFMLIKMGWTHTHSIGATAVLAYNTSRRLMPFIKKSG